MRSRCRSGGPAQFAFVSKCQNGASVPTGQTRFQFQVGDFTFESTSYDWMVVSGAKAQYKGSGTVNGGGDYGVMISVVDGDPQGRRRRGQVRIRIWEKTNGGVIYDTQLGDEDDAEATAINGGSIRIQVK